MLQAPWKRPPRLNKEPAAALVVPRFHPAPFTLPLALPVPVRVPVRLPPLSLPSSSSSSSSTATAAFAPKLRTLGDGNNSGEIPTYNVSFVLLPTTTTTSTSAESSSSSSSCWWPCWYLPDMDSAVQFQESLYQRRLQRQPQKKQQLEKEWLQKKQQMAYEMMERFTRSTTSTTTTRADGGGEHNNDITSPIWLVLGRRGCRHGGERTYSASAVTQYLSPQDATRFLAKAQELVVLAKTDPDLDSAMNEWMEYHKWLKVQQARTSTSTTTTTTAIVPAPLQLPARSSTATINTTTATTTATTAERPPTTTPMEDDSKNDHHNHSHPQGDSATVVTTSSACADQHEEQDEEQGTVMATTTATATMTRKEEREPEKPAAKSRGGGSSQGKKRGRPKSKTPTSRSCSKRRIIAKKSNQEEKEEVEAEAEEDANMTPIARPHERVAAAAVDDDEEKTPRTGPRTRYAKESSGQIGDTGSSAKFNARALEEACRGPVGRRSDVSRRELRPRQVFPPAAATPTTTTTTAPTTATGKTSTNIPPDAASKDSTEDPPSEESLSSETQSKPPEEPSPAVEDTTEPPPLEPEPLVEVELPGRTNREKLNSCLEALRKENESVVGCNKILGPRQAIHDFFTAVVKSKGISGSGDSVPVMHVCGAPGSGKSMTVEKCGELVKEAFSDTCDEWEVPPTFCYVNCSHMRSQSKEEALRITLGYAETTEKNLKRPSEGRDCRKPTVIFILDEIDYLVSSNNSGQSNAAKAQHRTRSEGYIETLLDWASNPRYMVGVIGISNSVENDKAARLVELGFPRSNKVIFRTYDEKDLTYIALSKIGKSVVEEQAIKLLSMKVAGSSGDARKFLEMLSGSIMGAMDGMTDEKLDAIHDKPVVKVSHAMKTAKASTIKCKDLVQEAPANEKVVLCLCIHLAQIIGSRSLPLSTMLEICQEANREFDLETVSELKSILERLLDSGLLKLQDKRIPANLCIRFDAQLEDVEAAVKEVLMKQSYFETMIKKLESMGVGGWTF